LEGEGEKDGWRQRGGEREQSRIGRGIATRSYERGYRHDLNAREWEGGEDQERTKRKTRLKGYERLKYRKRKNDNDKDASHKKGVRLRRTEFPARRGYQGYRLIDSRRKTIEKLMKNTGRPEKGKGQPRGGERVGNAPPGTVRKTHGEL